MELRAEHFPGVTEAGRRAAITHQSIADCPHDLGTVRHLAWVRGYVTARRHLEAGPQPVRDK